MGYSLDDEKYDSKGGNVNIFNNGKAGIAEDIVITLKRKTPEDKENAPNYKLTFTDSTDAFCEMPFWYVEKATDYKTIEQQEDAQGKAMKHILNAIYGEDKRPKVEATTAKEFLDGCMKAINEGLKAGGKFRVFANYGTPSSVKKYIQIRSWVPFMEPMGVAIADTRLKAGDFDAMARVEETSMTATASTGSSTSSDDDAW
jgi:hypothetical protein